MITTATNGMETKCAKGKQRRIIKQKEKIVRADSGMQEMSTTEPAVADAGRTPQKRRKRSHRGNTRNNNKLRHRTNSPKSKVPKIATVDVGRDEQTAESKIETPAATNSLRAKLVSKLQSSRFRFINEALYSASTADAADLFANDADAFRVYHEGFSQQVAKWPMDPLKGIISWIRTLPSEVVVADMGCGDARLARSIKQKCYSFDLVALNECVTVCNMDKVPLENDSVDVCVFCLSLMATNLVDIFKEANRIVKKGGKLKICEIESRFYSLKSFIEALIGLGFAFLKKKSLGDMFVVIELEKKGKMTNKRPKGLRMQPCLYKKR